MKTKTRNFIAGRCYYTRGVAVAFEDRMDDIMFALRQHVSGDWGCVCNDDKQTNEDALEHGGRLLSAYELNPKIWIITEADRSSTCILLPSEY